MQTIINIISKNIKLLLRSKSSALIIVIGPLLMIFLVGISFDNMERFNLNIGVYSDSYSELTDSLIARLEDNNFRVTKVESIDPCIEDIKIGTIHTCIEFPPNFDIESEINDLILYVDYSKLNLVWIVLNTLSTEIEQQSSEVSLGLTSILLDKLESVKIHILNINPIVDELKTQNQRLLSQLKDLKQEVLSINVKELKDSSTGLRTNILAKVNSARSTIITVQTSLTSALTGTNVSTVTKTSLEDKIALVDTYLYNIYSIIEDPNNLTESDWDKVINLADTIETDFLNIQSFLNNLEISTAADSEKLTQLETTLDSIYNDLQSLRITNATTIVNPINTEIKPVTPEKSYLDYLFPALIVLVVMFISILLSSTLVMMEKHSPAYFRTFLTPTRNIIFIISTYLTNMILVFVQVAIILAISTYFFQSQIILTLSNSLLILFITTSLFTFVGMAIGYLFTSEETATLAAVSVGSIMLFLSDVILPLESMPEYIARIAQFNPFVLAENLLRKAILFQSGLSLLARDMIILAIYAIALFLLIWAFHIISKKHFFHKLTYKSPTEKKT